MHVLSIPLDQYLALNNESLLKLRSHETICIMSAMQESQARLFTFVAPREHCWGMDIANSQVCETWFGQLTQQTDLLRRMKKDIKAAKRKLSEIALGLLPVGSDQEGDLAYGNEENSLHTVWFRSYAFPLADVDREFIALWITHEQQLAGFFLLPYSDNRVRTEGVGECASSGSADLLCRLFWDRHGQAGAGLQEQLALLDQFQGEGAKVLELNQLLKPEFLLHEHVRWSTSLLPPSSALQKLSAEVYEKMVGAAVKRSSDERIRVAILRMRLARALHWPLGVRLLAKQIEPYTSLPAKADLVHETEQYVDQALRKYPVLGLR
jgi:hypothetical protein